MKITDLIKKEAIDLNVKASTKKEIIEKAVELMAKNQNITNKEDYLKASRDFVKQSVSYDIKDFLPNGEKRMQLASIIEQLKNNTELMNDEHFIIDLENYLALTNYDEQEIKEEQSQFLSRKINLDKLM